MSKFALLNGADVGSEHSQKPETRIAGTISRNTPAMCNDWIVFHNTPSGVRLSVGFAGFRAAKRGHDATNTAIG